MQVLRSIPEFIVRAVVKAIAALDANHSAAARLGAFRFDDRHAIDIVLSSHADNHRVWWFRQLAPTNGVDVEKALLAMRQSVAYYRYRNGDVALTDDFYRFHEY